MTEEREVEVAGRRLVITSPGKAPIETIEPDSPVCSETVVQPLFDLTTPVDNASSVDDI